jgi:hypothetical protein
MYVISDQGELVTRYDEHQLAWISDPVNGARHDNYCLGESGVLLTLNSENWIGDKGYVGNDMITPFKKPADGELLDWQKQFNAEVNKIRWVIEQVISHFKNWRIMHTDLPSTAQDVRDDHLSGNRFALLPNDLNMLLRIPLEPACRPHRHRESKIVSLGIVHRAR